MEDFSSAVFIEICKMLNNIKRTPEFLKKALKLYQIFFPFHVNKGSRCKVQHNSLSRNAFQAMVPSTALLPTPFCIFFFTTVLHYGLLPFT